MRRLPVFFLLDVSESMAGENLRKLERGLDAVVTALRRDPHALETVWISVTAFAGEVRTLTPLTELLAFRPPELPIGGGTALGAALKGLMDEMDREVIRSSPERRGDWRPLVFLMTDGQPTDDVSAAAARWRRDWKDRAHLVAVSIGGGADHKTLERLTEDVLVFDDQAPDAFSRFLKWVTVAIQSQSRSVGVAGEDHLELGGFEADLIAPPSHGAGGEGFDERYAVLIGRCARTKAPYLLKYERQPQTGRHKLDLVLPLQESYFALSGKGGASGSTVDSGALDGAPVCPHCKAQFGLAIHNRGCGGVHCLAELGEETCPWCSKREAYAHAGHVGVGRGRG